MVRAVLADVLTAGRVVIGLAAGGALVAGRIDLLAALLSASWTTDVLDGRLARASGRGTFLGDYDLVVDTWVGACVVVGFGLSDRTPLWLAVAGAVVLGALYLWSKNPAISQVLQGIGYGASLWLILIDETSMLVVPVSTLAILLLAEHERFVNKVLPMFFGGVAALARRERYGAPRTPDRLE